MGGNLFGLDESVSERVEILQASGILAANRWTDGWMKDMIAYAGV